MKTSQIAKEFVTTIDIKNNQKYDLEDFASFNKLFIEPYKKHWEYIIIHHSATNDTIALDSLSIRNYHIKTNKWQEIGYHFLVEQYENPESYIYVIGRNLDVTGSHAGITTSNLKNYIFNKLGIGICFVGNFDLQPPNEKGLNKLIVLVKNLMNIFKININNVLGHWECFILSGAARTKDEAYKRFKTCPGKLFDMNNFRKLISRHE